MATDASRPTVSWLKFEPKVSNFPVTKTAIAVLVTCAIMTIFCFSIYFLKEERRQQLRKSESHAIKKSSLSLVYFFLLLFAKVVQSMWRELHQWAVVFGRMMSVLRNASVFETPNSV